VVTLAAPTVPSGSSVLLTLTTRDAAGNPLATGGATVVFNRAGGTSTGTISAATDNGDGTYSATFTGVTAGTATNIGATINGNAIAGPLPTLTVNPGPYSTAVSAVTVAGNPATLQSGAATVVTLHARDAAGNNLTSGGLAVGFSITGG